MQTARPRRASARAIARPTTPAPTTTITVEVQCSSEWAALVVRVGGTSCNRRAFAPHADCSVLSSKFDMASKRALITGITGQDGSYLAEMLLDEGYEVFGLTRRLSASNYWRIEHIIDRVTLIPGDL